MRRTISEVVRLTMSTDSYPHQAMEIILALALFVLYYISSYTCDVQH